MKTKECCDEVSVWVGYNKLFQEFYVSIIDDDQLEIKYCPFCGTKLEIEK